jgi:hypothetical protein
MRAILGIALVLSSSAFAKSILIDGVFSAGGAERLSMTGNEFELVSTQDQTPYALTECLAGEECAVDGRIDVSRGHDFGDAWARLAGLEFRQPFLAGFLAWTAPQLMVRPADIRNPGYSASVPIEVSGRVQGFQTAKEGVPGEPAFDYRLAGTGRLQLTPAEPDGSPRNFLGLVAGGSFRGTLTPAAEQGPGAPVPEPRPLGLLGLGVAALLGWKTRRVRDT